MTVKRYNSVRVRQRFPADISSDRSCCFHRDSPPLRLYAKLLGRARRTNAKYTDVHNPGFPARSSAPFSSKGGVKQQGCEQTSCPTVFGDSRCFLLLVAARIHNAEREACFGGNNVRGSPLNKQEHAVKATDYSRGERDCFQGECVVPEWQTAPDPCSLWRGRRRPEEVGSDCGAERW